MNQEINDYIVQSRANDASDDAIRQALINAGYAEVTLSEYFVVQPPEGISKKELERPQFKLWKIVRVVLLLVFVAGAFLFWYGRTLTLEGVDPRIGAVQTEKQNNIPTTTEDIPPEWETYTNTEYGITLRYPNDWEIDTKNRGNTLLAATAAKPYTWAKGMSVEWFYYDKDNDVVCDAMGNRTPVMESQKGMSDLKGMKDGSTKPILIGGLEGKILYRTNLMDSDQYQYEAYIKRSDGDMMYFFGFIFSDMSSEDARNLFRQILSSVSLSKPAELMTFENFCTKASVEYQKKFVPIPEPIVI